MPALAIEVPNPKDDTRWVRAMFATTAIAEDIMDRHRLKVVYGGRALQMLAWPYRVGPGRGAPAPKPKPARKPKKTHTLKWRPKQVSCGGVAVSVGHSAQMSAAVPRSAIRVPVPVPMVSQLSPAFASVVPPPTSRRVSVRAPRWVGGG